MPRVATYSELPTAFVKIANCYSDLKIEKNSSRLWVSMLESGLKQMVISRCVDGSDGGYRLKKNSRYMHLTDVYMTVIVAGWITTADISRCVDDSDCG